MGRTNELTFSQRILKFNLYKNYEENQASINSCTSRNLRRCADLFSPEGRVNLSNKTHCPNKTKNIVAQT